MKIVKNISDLKNLQEVYNQAVEINLSEKRKKEKFEKTFDVKKYKDLCERAKVLWKNL